MGFILFKSMATGFREKTLGTYIYLFIFETSYIKNIYKYKHNIFLEEWQKYMKD